LGARKKKHEGRQNTNERKGCEKMQRLKRKVIFISFPPVAQGGGTKEPKTRSQRRKWVSERRTEWFPQSKLSGVGLERGVTSTKEGRLWLSPRAPAWVLSVGKVLGNTTNAVKKGGEANHEGEAPGA